MSGTGRFAIVGAGTAYLPGIALAIAARADAFEGTTVVLHDIDAAALEPMAALARRIITERGSRSIAVETATELERALDGADLALATFRPGGYAGRISDEQIPLAFGMAGCESAGMGGFAMALRAVPAVVRVAEILERHGARGAVLLDYVNAVGIVTDGVRRAVPGVVTLGLCDQHLGEARFVAGVMGIDADRVVVDAAGANHCTWTRTVVVDGQDATADVLERLVALAPASLDPYWAPVARLAPQLGMIPNAYLRYYLEPDAVLAEQLARGLTRGEEAAAELPGLLAGYRAALAAADPVPARRRGGDDHGDFAVSLAVAIRTGAVLPVIVNTASGGAMPGIPADATVELPCRLEGVRAVPLPVEPLPLAAMTILGPVVRHQRLAADAALGGDRATMLEPMLAHPLGPSRASAASMLDVILVASQSTGRAA
jgi:6-phospho-beta-glucosidase